MSEWTKQRQAEVKARCKAATKGPWEFNRFKDWTMRAPNWGIVATLHRHDIRSESLLISECNAEFTAHARIDLPDAIAEIERLQKKADSSLSLGKMAFDPEPFIDGEDDRNSDMKWFMDGQWRKERTDV